MGISKRYASVVALQPLTLEVEPGSLVSLLGPSGCGKTTTLRIVAGFERPDSGVVKFGARDVTRLEPNRRNLGMVFQNYSLFPHMNVAKNVSFGLETLGIPEAERTKRVAAALEMVQLPHVAERYPRQLSGGQQQRIALARAVVTNPTMLLLDEPLGALDKNLREAMQFELRAMQRSLGITTILVTHDQEEAMTMSDTIAVMRDGRIVQHGSPDEVYLSPSTRFVSEFLGTSNIVPVSIAGPTNEGLHAVKMRGADRMGAARSGRSFRSGEAALIAIRPEKIAIVPAGHPEAGLTGTVVAVAFRGSHRVSHVDVPGQDKPFIVNSHGEAAPIGAEVGLCWAPRDAVLIPDDSEAVSK